MTKHGEYADAGIRHYWIIDLEKPPNLVACGLAAEFGYQVSPAAVGRFEAQEPFGVRIELNKLV